MHSAEFLREVLQYDPETGVLTFKENRGSNKVKGKVAGFVRKDGYHFLSLQKKRYLGHRIIWAMMTGDWPENQIDHIDGVRSNNKWANLRAATPSQNNANHSVRIDSKIGLKGVQIHPDTGKWRARINIAGTTKHLGLFNTPEEAHAAFVAAASKVHGAYARAS